MKARILLVEDDDAIRDLLADWLTEQGYRITAARDGAEARDCRT